MMCRILKSILLTFMIIPFWQDLHASLKMPAIFSDNMVLQQRSEVNVWGWADPGHEVKVFASWNGVEYKCVAGEDGKWQVSASTPGYGGPFSIDVATGSEILQFQNVLIGDVWVCSGQSNMEMPLAGWGQVMDYKREIEKADYPEIRLLQAAHVTSNLPLDDISINNGGSWRICSPESVAEFSSVAYFFARDVYTKTRVPIGLIHSSWGGTFAEAWTSKESLQQMPDFDMGIKAVEMARKGNNIPYTDRLQEWIDQTTLADSGMSKGKPIWLANVKDDESWGLVEVPDLWKNHPLAEVDGIIWMKKVIDVPASMLGADLKLSLGLVDDNDITFFNGKEIGRTQGYNQVRTYTVPARLLREGRNEIAVRVFDTGGGGGIYGDKNELALYAGQKKLDLVGVWKYKVGLNFKEFKTMPISEEGPNRPTVLYNAMVHPLIKFTIKGVIWYQGESNADRAQQYRQLFPLLIKDWRKQWGQGVFPFYFVQLANFMERSEQPLPKSDWASLRDAQRAALVLPQTGMAVITDVGDAKDIHPKNKQEVGRRLALIALNKTYKQALEFSGPVLTRYKLKDKQIILYFKHADGLQLEGRGFAVAGKLKIFHWAHAKVKGNKVVVSSDEVDQPEALLYNWESNPGGLLKNASGLPASGFYLNNLRR